MMHGCKLWIDDLRQPPLDWTWVKSSREAIAFLDFISSEGMVWMPRTIISFDHDLGGDDTTRPVVIYMIENGIVFDKYQVHSANPVGREWLEGMIERYLL